MKKLLLLGTILIIALFSFTGCSVKYNAQLNSDAETFISEEFLKQNRVKAYYRNEDYVEGVSDWHDRFIYEENAPESITYVITNQNEFNEIFTHYDSPIDLESKTVILYIFSDVNIRDYYLKKVYLEEQTLIVRYKLEKSNKADAVMLYQRCFMIILDKIDFNQVEFIEIK